MADITYPTHGSWRTLRVGLLFALYPLLIYLGLRYFDPRWVALLLIVVAGSRLLGKHLLTRKLPRKTLVLWGGAIVVASGFTLLTGSELGILLYPVLINLALLILFATTLLQPPSMIESLARMQEPDLSEAGVRYTRKVTQVWCVFFMVNGAIALTTVALATQGFGREWWLLYNGLIAYVLMAALFMGELLVRKHVRARGNTIESENENA